MTMLIKYSIAHLSNLFNFSTPGPPYSLRHTKTCKFPTATQDKQTWKHDRKGRKRDETQRDTNKN